MKLIKNILLLAAACLVTFSCKEVEEPEVKSFVNLSETSIQAGPDGGEFTVIVNSSEDWAVSGLCDWITLSTENGSDGEELGIKVLPNELADTQTTCIKVFAGSATASLNITSEAGEFNMSLKSERDITVTSKEQSIQVEFNSNIDKSDFTVEIPAEAKKWISLAETRNSIGRIVVALDIAESDVYVDRDAKVTVKAKGFEETVNVKQLQLNAILTEKTEIKVKDLSKGNLQIKVRANVEPKANINVEWLTAGEVVKGSKAADGLTDYTFNFSYPASDGTRKALINFTSQYLTIEKSYLQVLFVQQNPDPVYGKFDDPDLRRELVRQGWITEDSELLVPGLQGESLTIAGPAGWNRLEIESIAGLGAFPNLKDIKLKYCTVKTLDLTDVKALNSVTIEECIAITDILCGDAAIENLNIKADCLGVGGWPIPKGQHVSISGTALKNISARSESPDMQWERIEYMDISGCTALEKADIFRYGVPSWGGYGKALATLYISQAQQDAIDAGTFELIVHQDTAVTVK